ncbi:MaoC family dehydratase [Planotetraspora kaengkrachanensis]|uniref:MaoC family dehydratase n=1 Tax=Planotetraspora kaengkrachanensis TaxID=575193 RepID=A0A8J3PSG7_9ACTN|nr:MaoC family dehydratase [Planotetraspora kaengkrachanensis]GIG80866.1 MaoC family dehydratase [Planotetraspora kaengkrachanensis]
MRIFNDVAELKAAKGEHLGYTDWREITQERVNGFADATDDHQWIHVDVDRAKEGPFGSTIAHGYLSLALIPSLAGELYRVDGLKMGINYGLNKVRFIRPIPVGSQIRAGAEIADVKGTPSGTLATVRVVIEVAGVDKPACIAETLSLLVPDF